MNDACPGVAAEVVRSESIHFKVRHFKSLYPQYDLF